MQEQRTIQVYDRAGAREIPYHGDGEIVPATFRITSTKLEANIFNRLLPAEPKDYAPYVPRPPSSPVTEIMPLSAWRMRSRAARSR